LGVLQYGALVILSVRWTRSAKVLTKGWQENLLIVLRSTNF